jgi:hypothetical protein
MARGGISFGERFLSDRNKREASCKEGKEGPLLDTLIKYV